ncbi:MAG: Hpt domain-containing protein [Proteobacteria bacterium]|nr:Hpt domain-containing protein [Pseudomonadota bacterium]
MADQPRAQLIEPEEHLGEKVTEGGPGAVNSETLQRAEQVIADMADSYAITARNSLETLALAYAALSAKGSDNAAELIAVFEIAHEIKGQAGTFKFDLMTVVANQLCQFIDGLGGSSNRKAIEVVGLHVDALQMILAQNLKGDGGKAGQALIRGLRQVVEKRS